MGMSMNMGITMSLGRGTGGGGGGGYGSTPVNDYSTGGGHNRGMSSKASVRSTPRTNASPHSMNLGDATPLYDEN